MRMSEDAFLSMNEDAFLAAAADTRTSSTHGDAASEAIAIAWVLTLKLGDSQTTHLGKSHTPSTPS